ncbi:MAG TPA: acyltransferase domain-containing protein, partial [Kofleriaceae bacterium]|nr:acyltransferase domain-containing protein [Kofleriaceae bacterium]
DGQVRALERAYRMAGVSPADVGLVEAHGTGTVVGDRTELQTLTEVYKRAGAAVSSCVLGSVKSQIGHTKCAAGMAGLIKAALSIHHGVLPPTLNIKKPSSAWNGDDSPFVFLDQARPWPIEERIAAVSAFGFGGTNFHAILAAHRGAEARPTEAWPAELLLFHGDSREIAMELVARVDKAAARPGVRLRDLARTTCAAGTGAVQLAIVAESVDDLRTKIEAARTGKADRGVFANESITAFGAGSVAFLCPGQGSQRPGMLAELFVSFPRLHRLLELGAPWAKTMFPRAAFTRDERSAQQAAITDTRVAQPTLGIADLAVAEIIQLAGVRPAMLAGHSYGELAALCIAGAMSEPDLLALSQARGELILDAAGADPGTMAAVAADAAVVAPIVAGVEGCVIANLNSPTQCVLSGTTAAIEMALVLVGAAGLTARRIPVACAFHSQVVAGAKDAFARRLAGTAISAPTIPVYSNVTAQPYPADAVRELLAEQIANPVRFTDEIRAMYAAGARIFVETGPGQVLTKLVGEILGDKPHLAVACDTGEASLRQLLRALGAIAVAGAPVDAQSLFWDRDAEIVDLGLEAKPTKATAWLVNGHSARPFDAPKQVAQVMTPMVAVGAAMPVGQPAGVTSERDVVVVEFLRNMRSMISAQRDVVLSYLGSAPQPSIETFVAPAHVIDVAPTPVAPVPDKPAILDPMQLVISIVSERTGYPADTLGVDLDLEADLSIDSIKRIEIIGELAERLGLRVGNGAAKEDADAMVEELAGKKTLRALVAWLSDRMAKPAPVVDAIETAVTTPTVKSNVTAPARYTMSVVEAPLPINGHSTYAGKHFAIVGLPAIAPLLEAEGAIVRHLAAGEAVGTVDGFVHAALAGDPVPALRELFVRVREAALGGAKTIVVATSLGGRWQGEGIAGAAGLLKTIAAEYPGVKVRAVDVEAGDDVAARLHAELHAHDEHVEIGYANDVRATIAATRTDATAPPLSLSSDAVVMVTGGARGITALAAIELARRFRCRIELVGRSPYPGDEDATLATLPDAAALRGFYAKRGLVPAEIEQTATRILADREIRATIAAIKEAGASVTYHAVDVRTPAFGELIDTIYTRHGRIDGVIHGAGVLEDKLVRDKTPES